MKAIVKAVSLVFAMFFMLSVANVGSTQFGLNDALACKGNKCKCERKGKNGKTKKCKCEDCEVHKKDAAAPAEGNAEKPAEEAKH